MFKRPLRLYTTQSINILTGILRHKTRCVSTAAKPALETKEKWDLIGAICVERHPVIAKPMNEIETKYKDFLDQIEFENSMKSDHELRLQEDQKQEQLIRAGSLEIDLDVVRQTGQDFEDASIEELKKFELAPKITEADKNNDVTSLNRKLDRNLLLLVEQKLGKDTLWMPPQGIRMEGETLRQTAERVLKESCGEKLNVKFYGNAPCGFYKYKYPKTMRESGVIGAKVFYYQAKYLSGSSVTKTKCRWLDREELHEALPNRLKDHVFEFLIDED